MGEVLSLSWIDFAGRPRNLDWRSGDVRLIVTADVGPRVLWASGADGMNHLAVYERHHGLSGGGSYRSYGGHRLWTAPEVPERTYEPDNDPVEVDVQGEWTFFQTGTPSAVGLLKSIGLAPGPGKNSVRVRHTVVNVGSTSHEVAAWAITVMRPGGFCLFPQPDFVPHGQALLPSRPLVLWPYANMSDPRWQWGQELIRLDQTPAENPQKAGAFVSQGWAAYIRGCKVFLKQFPADPSARYPDMGCNFEAFTRHDMLEMESLSPLTWLAPGQSIHHDEVWTLLNLPAPPSSESEWRRALEQSLVQV